MSLYLFDFFDFNDDHCPLNKVDSQWTSEAYSLTKFPAEVSATTEKNQVEG